MPELTISMPARNAGRFIADAIASVLQQDGVDLELIVVDDASTDDTASLVAGIRDTRVQLVRNPARRGIGACHNQVLDRSHSPFIAHVDADDVLRSGALRAMIDALCAAPTAGQAHCHFYYVDAEGGASCGSLRAQRRRLLVERPPGADYRRGLLVHGMVVNALRTYRRAVFEKVGRFDERLPYAVDYEMALRVAEAYDIVLVPEFLYLVRVHDQNVTARLRFQGPRFWWKRLTIVRRLLRERRSTLLGRDPSAVYGLMLVGLLHVAGIPRIAKRLVRVPLRFVRPSRA